MRRNFKGKGLIVQKKNRRDEQLGAHGNVDPKPRDICFRRGAEGAVEARLGGLFRGKAKRARKGRKETGEAEAAHDDDESLLFCTYCQ